MDKIYTLILFLLLFSLDSYSQGIAVSSFRLLDNDLDAITSGTEVLDQNGNRAALIKVVTTETGFNFDCGSLGIVKTEHHPAEFWVYVPAGIRRMTISNQQLGVLRDYQFPIPIEQARTYEMVLTTDQVQTIIKHDIGGQYVVMKVSPASAIVTIDDVELPTNNGETSKFLSYGNHTYRVTSHFYQDAAGIIEMGRERKEISVTLKPNYSILSLSTVPENGARVTIDDEGEAAGVTPFITDRLTKGKHRFRFQLSQYATKDTSITVGGDGLIEKISVPLTANFANVSIKAQQGSHIVINNDDKGTNIWNGRLTEGMYVVEARRESYRSTTKSIDVKRGQDLNLELEPPTPIYGILNINSEPIGASIYVDDELIGTTPNVFNNILAGKRTLRLAIKDYTDFREDIMVDEGKVTDLNAILSKQQGLGTTVPSSQLKYVDLGLSVYWSTCNLGANVPTGYGNFYAWGEIKPKDTYSWGNYAFGNRTNLTKYNSSDNKVVLDKNDDVATYALGNSWHIPTTEEWSELRENCKWQWTSLDGINGYMVTANNGNSIFLPAPGYYYGSQGYVSEGIEGEYWTRNLSESKEYAYNVKIAKGVQDFYAGSRCCGFSVRSVLKKNDCKPDYDKVNVLDGGGTSPGFDSPTASSYGNDGDDTEEEPLNIAEKMPSFNGNINQWLAQHLQFPASALENGIHGRVVVRFVIGKDGSVSQARIIIGVDPALDNEALRVINSMPRWNPGMNNGQPVSVWYSLPLDFLLDNDSKGIGENSHGIAVSSFRLLDNDLDAITLGTEVFDQNGNRAALIKIVTTQTGFSFDCGSLGIVKVVRKPTGYWVYVPAGVRRITITHPRLGVLRDYTFPIAIQEARTYEMVLK